jgi:hypothetical protein
MAEDDRTVHCAGCGLELDEPSSLPPEQRQPCPECGSTARQFRIALSATVSAVGGIGTAEDFGNVTVHATRATATAGGRPGEVVISGTFKRSVTWSKTPGGTMWLGEIHDPNGQLVGVAIQESADDVLLILAEHLMPPGTY